jgi:antitoxin MazE
MKAEIIKIGNSQGIRIPKKIIEQCGIKTSIELSVKDNSIILTPISEIRKGWAESFGLMAKNNDDYLIDENARNSFDQEGWEW